MRHNIYRSLLHTLTPHYVMRGALFQISHRSHVCARDSFPFVLCQLAQWILRTRGDNYWPLFDGICGEIRLEGRLACLGTYIMSSSIKSKIERRMIYLFKRDKLMVFKKCNYRIYVVNVTQS